MAVLSVSPNSTSAIANTSAAHCSMGSRNPAAAPTTAAVATRWNRMLGSWRAIQHTPRKA